MTDELYPWLWKCRPFTVVDLATGKWVGFCYRIINHTNNRYYIGRKYFIARRKTKTTMSDWQEYWGSSNDLQKDIANIGKDQFTREIISLHKTRGATNFSERELLYRFKVLEDPLAYNKSIDGKYNRINRTQSIYDERIMI